MSYDPVDWGVAERVAVAVSRRSAPLVDERTQKRLEEDFARASELAERLVEAHTGLESTAGPARAKVTDRAGWIEANISSFRRLLSPLFEKMGEGPSITRALPGALGQATRAAAGAELGAVLGWMSTRVLGQYDLLYTEGGDEPDDAVYYVGPNVVSLERRHGFPPGEFRLWIAVHELTHRAQFTGVGWVRGYFMDLVAKGVGIAAPDPKALAACLKRAYLEIRAGENPLASSGLVGVFATAEQREVLSSVRALMSVLEGHGDVTMNRAAAEQIPGAKRFSSTLQSRRESAGGAARLFQQLIGLEAKFRQYKEGELFVETVIELAGDEVFSLIWQGPEYLPSIDELAHPGRWVQRVKGRSLEIA